MYTGWGMTRIAIAGATAAALLVGCGGSTTPMDQASIADLATAQDLASAAPSYSVTGFASGLGARVSASGIWSLEGAVGIPGPRTTSSGGAWTVEPLLP